MPKRIQEIKNFHAGIISTPDESDIPIDASPRSENIEPLNVDGRLEGIPADLEKLDGVRATSMVKINNDGTYHVVYYNESTTKFRKIDDLHGSPSTADLSSSAETSISSPTMAVNNKEVHIGTGHANKPKWAGFIENDQFASTAPTTVQLCDAELINPSAFVDVIKFVEKSGYIYGVELNGSQIYKFDIANRTLVRKSQEIFGSLKSLCLSGDESHLWILDEDGGKAVVKKVDLSNMVAEFSLDISATNPAYWQDIHHNGSDLWFNYGNPDDTDGFFDQNQLYSRAESYFVAGATVTVANRQPDRSDGGGNTVSVGTWVKYADSDDPYSTWARNEVQYKVPRIALCNIGSNTYVGWCAQIRSTSNNSIKPRLRCSNTGADNVQAPEVFNCIIAVSASATNSDVVHKIWNIKPFQTGDNFMNPSTWNDFTKKMYSVSSKKQSDGSARVVITFGNHDETGNTTVADLGTIQYASANPVNTALTVAETAKTSVELTRAYASIYLSTDKLSAFDGKTSGRWMESSTVYGTGLTPALESNVGMSFAETGIDYGEGSYTANSRIGFKDNSTQFYKISYLYDGYQESPLSDEFISQVTATNGKGNRVTVELRNLGLLNRRISHICLYRADAENRNSNVQPSGFFRLIEISKLDISWSLITVSGGVWSDFRRKVFVDNNIAGASYSARTGISEVLTDVTPSYSLSTGLNNSHFIANIKQTTLGHLSNYILKSKVLNFDQFNYVEDFLALPTTPTAIAGFNGRLYAFDENNTYRIEPNGFYVEDVYEGVGCINSDCVVVTEFGMFFADKNNIYIHNGQTPKTIGDAILKGDDSDSTNSEYGAKEYYLKLLERNYAKMAFDGKRNAILLTGEYWNGNTYYPAYTYFTWAYSLKKGRWDLWTISANSATYNGSNKPLSFLSDRDGNVLYSDGTKLWHYMGHASTKKVWEWNSKEITGGYDTLNKSFIEIYIGGNPNLDSAKFDIYIDGFIRSNEGDDTYKLTDKLGGGKKITLLNKKITVDDNGTSKTIENRVGKKLRIRLSNQDKEVDSIGIIYRPIGVSDVNI